MFIEICLIIIIILLTVNTYDHRIVKRDYEYDIKIINLMIRKGLIDRYNEFFMEYYSDPNEGMNAFSMHDSMDSDFRIGTITLINHNINKYYKRLFKKYSNENFIEYINKFFTEYYSTLCDRLMEYNERDEIIKKQLKIRLENTNDNIEIGLIKNRISKLDNKRIYLSLVQSIKEDYKNNIVTFDNSNDYSNEHIEDNENLDKE